MFYVGDLLILCHEIHALPCGKACAKIEVVSIYKIAGTINHWLRSANTLFGAAPSEVSADLVGQVRDQHLWLHLAGCQHH